MKKVILSLFLSVVSLTAFAQKKLPYKWEYGGHIFASNYLGDMGGKEKTRRDFVADIKLGQTRYDFGGYARMKINQNFSLKGVVSYIRVQGADNLSTNAGRVGRNLSFTNNIIEGALHGEYYFYQNNDMSRGSGLGKKKKGIDFKSYVFGGIAGFYNNPKTTYQGSKVKLRPLQTEGYKYKAIQLAIPIGAGFVYTINRQLKIGFEFDLRKTFTDYVDDVSTVYIAGAPSVANRRNELTDPSLPHPDNYITGEKRGDPKHKDFYMTAGITFGYALKGKNSFYKSKYSYITGVKRKFKKRRTRAKF